MKINIKVPEKWEKKLEKLAKKNQQSLDELILKILADYLNFDYSDFQVKKLQEELNNLTKRVKELEKQDYEFKQQTNKLEILEKLVDSLQISIRQSKSIKTISINEEMEEMEDEADEVLTEFLVNQ